MQVFFILLLSYTLILHYPVTPCLLGPNILLNTLFSNTLGLCSLLNVSDQVSHPYKTTGRIIVLYSLIFRKWEGVVGTGWSWLRIGTGGGRL